jgi:hypothetical protein
MRTSRVGTRLTIAAALAVACALALAACGGSSDSAPGVAEIDTTSPPPAESVAPQPAESVAPPPASTERDATDILVDFAECIRDEGYDLPDPDFSLSAGEYRRQLLENGIDVDDPAFEAVVDACEPRLSGILQAFSIEELQTLGDATLAYAQCMRAEGIDVPDPDFTRGVTSVFGDLDVSQPGFDEADEKCSVAFDDVPNPFEDEG